MLQPDSGIDIELPQLCAIQNRNRNADSQAASPGHGKATASNKRRSICLKVAAVEPAARKLL
jgi:hypothetical protein